MESLFKQKLLTLRSPLVPKSFAEALFPDGPRKEKSSTPQAERRLQVEQFSEKVQIIESLERFATEKASTLDSPVFNIEGGQIHVKPEPQWSGVPAFASVTSLAGELLLEDRYKKIVIENKTPEAVRVLFVSERFRTWDEIGTELRQGFTLELIVGFPVKTAEFFERMIGAMKLTPEEVIVYPVEGSDENDYAEDVMKVAGHFLPEVIITLGAKATSRILKSNDRLSLIHGQFFSRKIGETSFQVVPLFHPSIIETNQNMKKTAWSDMQKIMKYLKKIP